MILHRKFPVKSLLGAVLLACSAAAMAQAPSGKWTGSGPANLGNPARCTPTMTAELVVENGKLKGKLDFGNRVQEIEADVSPDGKFETTFVNPFGHTLSVTGKLGDTLTVNNPIRCGYGDVPLKKQ
jgi:hypothetical protein